MYIYIYTHVYIYIYICPISADEVHGGRDPRSASEAGHAC